MRLLFNDQMMHSRPLSVVSSVALAAWLLAGCGGGSGHRAGGSSSPTSSSGVTVTEPVVVDPSPNVAVPLVASGTPTGLAAGAGATGVISATVDGTLCTVDDPLISCVGATGSGGQFVVTVENDPNDFSVRTVGIRCGLAPAATMASSTGKQLVILGSLTFSEFGDVIGVARYGAGDEAFLVFQPSGSTCPQVFGMGLIKANSIMSGGNNVVGVTRPDGSLACVVADGAGAFVVAEQQSACPLQ